MRRRFESSAAAIAFLGPGMARMRCEMLCVAHLDSDDGLIGLRLRYARRVDRVDLPIRTIVADALALQSAALIVAHNHPGGIAEPSSADLAATRTLADVVRPLGLWLHDHLVFAERCCFSFRGAGLL
ncbi:JAB domain-containing protein [Sphingomonas cavernae]|nr:JAB domain-containing protein [Sphingomonas cavernae]